MVNNIVDLLVTTPTKAGTILSEAQQQEILERDRQYEAGEMKSYSLDEVITHFNIGRKYCTAGTFGTCVFYIK